MSMIPLSVVMPVRNALPYLDAAMKSILEQSYRDFEFVIRDDGSTDGTRESLRQWARRDARIRLFEGASLGPAGSSNFVVEQARAPIVARMDGDDLARTDRLQRQLDVLNERADAVLVGSLWHGIDSAGAIVSEPDYYRLRFGGFGAPFAHGSIMFRRGAFDRAGGYRQACDFWEDLDLYVRMAEQGKLLVIKEPLYQYRFSPVSARLTVPRPHVERAIDLMLHCRQLFERGEDYSALLEEQRSPGGRIDPNVFLVLAYLALWSGQRPSLLRALIERGDLRPDLRSAKALALAIWAEMSPGSLRRLMRFVIGRRSRRAQPDAQGDVVQEWAIRAAPPRS